MHQEQTQTSRPKGPSIFSGLNNETNTMNFYDEEYGYEHYAAEEERGISPRNDEMPIFTQSKEPISVLSDGTKLYPIPRVTEFFSSKNKQHRQQYNKAMEETLLPISKFIDELSNPKNVLTKILNKEFLQLSDEEINEMIILNKNFFIAYDYSMENMEALQAETRGEALLCKSVLGQDYYGNYISFPLRSLLAKLDEYICNTMDEQTDKKLLEKQTALAHGQKTAVVDFYKEIFDKSLLPFMIGEKFGDANLGYTFDDMSLPVLRVINEYMDKQPKTEEGIINDEFLIKLICSNILSDKSKFGKFISAKGMGEGITHWILEREEPKDFIKKSGIPVIRKLFDLLGEDEELYYVFLSRPVLFKEINEINVDTLSKANEQGGLGNLKNAVGYENDKLKETFHSTADIYTISNEPVATITGFNQNKIELYQFPEFTKFFDLYNPKHVEKVSKLIEKNCKVIKDNFIEPTNSKLDIISENLVTRWNNGKKSNNTDATVNVFKDYQIISEGIRPVYNYLGTAYEYFSGKISRVVTASRSRQETNGQLGRNVMRTDSISNKLLSNITELIRDSRGIILSLIPEGSNDMDDFYNSYMNVSNNELPTKMNKDYTEGTRLRIGLLEKLSGRDVNDADGNFDSYIGLIYKIPVEILRILTDKAQTPVHVEKIKVLLNLGILNGTEFAKNLAKRGISKIIVERMLDENDLFDTLQQMSTNGTGQQIDDAIVLFNTLSKDRFMHDLYFRFTTLIHYSLFYMPYIGALKTIIAKGMAEEAYKESMKEPSPVAYFRDNFLQKVEDSNSSRSSFSSSDSSDGNS